LTYIVAQAARAAANKIMARIISTSRLLNESMPVLKNLKHLSPENRDGARNDSIIRGLAAAMPPLMMFHW